MSKFSPFDFTLPEEVETLLGGSEFVYATNPGNAGDCVIACSSHRYFDRKGWKYKVLPPDAPPSASEGRVLVYAGGGNMLGPTSHSTVFMSRHIPGAAAFVMLPHTVRGNEEFLASLDERCAIIAREQTTYRHLRENLVKAKAHLAHDMAFSLDIEGLLRDGARRFWPLFSSRKLILRNAKRMVRRADRLVRARGDRATLNAFRDDAERTDIAKPRDNIDVSQGWAADDLMPLNSFETTYRMIQFLDSFGRINTNRLHVAICGALLGKEVHLHANSYSKNEDIYRHSLADRFPNVVWEG